MVTAEAYRTSKRHVVTALHEVLGTRPAGAHEDVLADMPYVMGEARPGGAVIDEQGRTIMSTQKRLSAMFPMKTLVLLAVIGVMALPLPTLAENDKLGKVTFPTSCDPSVQQQFERGVAMLHSFWFIQARKTFEEVLQQDPNCAVAYWGIAVDLLGNTLVGPPPPKNLQMAWEALEKAHAIGAKTPRERDWIDALSAYYRDHEKVPVDARLLAYTKAMEQLTQRYPDDFEAWVFYALTLQAAAPKADKTYANQLKSAAILERLLQQDPQHPGVAHFLIHAYDYPPLAEKGLPAARRYTGLAPAASHARHMPSHIYSMIGLWEESIASNRFALEIQPDYYHAADFMVYAHLQRAQDAKAKAVLEQAAATKDTGTRVVTFGNFTALAAMPARYTLERADWKGAAALPITSTEFPMADSLTRFTRGLGMARSGDLAGAKQEVAAMQEMRTALAQANQSYWADRTEEQRLAISAWVALAEGAREQAIRLMRAAADGEDGSVKHVAMENRLYPMRELLGELLLQMGEAAPALHEFEVSLGETPNRYRGLYGAAQAAEAAGERQKARGYFEKLVALTENADTPRPEIASAKALLGQR
jgi:tetratricopeptide (TPR) repeat protein